LAYIFVFLGMVSVAVYRRVQHGTDAARPFSYDLVIAALVSPIVYRAFVSGEAGLEGRSRGFIALSGYQNGFFWETLFSELMPSA
jgi:hypothetical protein